MREATIAVLGAGPSGLATAACLQGRGLSPVVLERADRVAPSWRNHYRRLHLHTVKQHSSLPGLPWPDAVPTYPARQEVVDYLEDYARHFGITPRFGTEVTQVRRVPAGWEVKHTHGLTEARAVVVCTGYNRVPLRPTWPGQDTFPGEILHSGQYRDGAPFRGKRVLVVGAGNSGAEIALDLWESGATVALCIRGPLHVVPRDVLGIPAQVTSLGLMQHLPPRLADRLSLAMLRLTVGDLSPWGIVRPEVGPISQVVRDKKIPLIDVGTVALIRQGKIAVVPGIEAFTETGARFVDGRELVLDAVILATGYRTGIEGFLEDAPQYLDPRGYPRPAVEPAARAAGIFFVGYRNPLTGALHDIAREAQRVADTIAEAQR